MGVVLSPTEFAALVDNYYEAKRSRLEADKAAARLKTTESYLKDVIIHQLRTQEVEVIGGKKLTVTLQKLTKPTVVDWPAVYGYIAENDAFDLLHRRLTTSAVEARWEQEENVPGVIEATVYDISESTVRPKRKGAK